MVRIRRARRPAACCNDASSHRCVAAYVPCAMPNSACGEFCRRGRRCSASSPRSPMTPRRTPRECAGARRAQLHLPTRRGCGARRSARRSALLRRLCVRACARARAHVLCVCVCARARMCCCCCCNAPAVTHLLQPFRARRAQPRADGRVGLRRRAAAAGARRLDLRAPGRARAALQAEEAQRSARAGEQRIAGGGMHACI